MVRCKAPDCKKQASFGPVGGSAEFCKTHKLAEYIDLVHKKCSHSGCATRPTYGDAVNGIALYCVQHKLSSHVNVKDKKCSHSGCSKRPNYGDIANGVALYCTQHKLSSHVNVKDKKCSHSGCSKSPTYGDTADGNALYCVQHKLSNHVNVISKRCAHSGCSKRPTYGDTADGIALYCVQHKLSSHIDLKNKRCTHLGCSKLPTFGNIADGIVLYCIQHKSSNHVNVKDKKCSHSGCSKRPYYGDIANGVALYCTQHKLSTHIDLGHKRCVHPDCKTSANFGMPGYSPEYCAQHKKPDMVSRNKKVKAEKKTCSICCIDVHYSEQYCPSCKTYLTDGKTIKRHQKELEVKALLDEKKIAYTHDIVVKDGCSKKRPDFVIATTWGTIILEVDEHQHNRKTYTCECELTRMRQLYFDVGVENLLFIRYNPDTYDTMSADKPMPKKQRKEYLAKYLQERLDTPHQKLGVVYLFYDKFTPTCVEIEAIDPYLSKAESS